MRPGPRFEIAATVALACALTLAGCLRIPPSAEPIPPAASRQSAAETATSLGGVEVREYKGKRLDEVASEPDNSIKGRQDIDPRTYRLSVGGDVTTPMSFTYAEITAMPAFQKVTTLNCVEGWSRTYLWQGVRIADLLEQAGSSPRATIIIFRSADGYSTSLPLDYVLERDILLAYRLNGVALPPERGFPFQVVAEDRLGYKWAKWVTEIEVSDDETFRGYWEQRGYDNSATLP